ncbi:MAG: cytochrome c oxidase assembly protein, partial [Actinomycetota bacterium]
MMQAYPVASGATLALSPWAWHFHPDVWATVVFLAASYAWALKSVGPRYVEPGERPATRRQVLWFCLGLLALWASGDWPLHDLAERQLYSAHMVQHLTLSLVAPPLLLAGVPSWLARALLSPRPVMAVMRRLTRPLPALGIFNAVLVTTHWPPMVDLSLTSHTFHLVTHTVLTGAALLMWWPILSPLPELPRIPYPAQMLYLFLQTIIPTVPASFLTFTTTPIYHIYETLPRAFSISVVDDQRLAGLIMKLGGGVLLWSVIAVLF